ncbi:MAG: TIGR03915 family putative DNA repair protein [Eubacteriales bacterium]|nr:TIGR03915 family putative DNA repair protein [Eubacteriales bacterium]
MKVFCCKDTFEDMMSCIYDAWSVALQEGHENVRLEREPIYQQSLFDEYIHVDYDEEKVRKVVRSIRNKISWQAYMSVFYACLSIEEDALQAIYNYLRVGFRVGEQVTFMQTDPSVMRMMELRRKTQNEAHYFLEFARFSSVDGKVYVCHLEPKNNITLIVGEHFVDRMPSEHWVIVDDTRKTAIVHPKDEELYIRYLTDEEFDALLQTKEYEDTFTDLWRTFFHAISIKERENPKCQRNMFPIWMRKNAVEFQ